MFLAQRAIRGELLPERLEQFESTIGATFPDDYRDFMLENNGGVVSPKRSESGPK